MRLLTRARHNAPRVCTSVLFIICIFSRPVESFATVMLLPLHHISDFRPTLNLFFVLVLPLPPSLLCGSSGLGSLCSPAGPGVWWCSVIAEGEREIGRGLVSMDPAASSRSREERADPYFFIDRCARALFLARMREVSLHDRSTTDTYQPAYFYLKTLRVHSLGTSTYQNGERLVPRLVCPRKNVWA